RVHGGKIGKAGSIGLVNSTEKQSKIDLSKGRAGQVSLNTMTRRTAAKKTVDLVYKLDGALKEIDVFKLAPALTGLGEIVQNAHKILGAEHEVGVNVRPFERGSFVVEISLFVRENLPLFTLGG